jgi:uncharacterized protein YkwD
MRRVALLVASLVLVWPASASAAEPYEYLLAPESSCPGQLDANPPPAIQAQVMLCMNGWARAQSGLTPVHTSKKLRSSSLRKAKDVRRCQQLSHEACGRDGLYWIQRVGFAHGRYGAGEVLGLGTGGAATARGVMSSWLNSDAHRSILLDRDWDSVGMSAVRGNFRGHPDALIWVVHVGFHRAPPLSDVLGDLLRPR